MTPAAVVAYVPVLHDGYRRFLEQHARRRPLHLIGPDLHADERPLAKDIRRLDADLAAQAIASWGICSEVHVLDVAGAVALAEGRPALVLPDEDVSRHVAQRFFARCPYLLAPVFLRWDRDRTVRMLVPDAAAEVTEDEAVADLAGAAEAQARRSLDWWRRVGAALRLRDGELLAAANQHHPHPLSPYAVGDPRANFSRGVHLELSTATHAEAALVATAARRGASTEGAIGYVTDFPCPPCAKLLAAAGIARLYFRTGYTVLDGQDVLEAAGVELIRVGDPVGAR